MVNFFGAISNLKWRVNGAELGDKVEVVYIP